MAAGGGGGGGEFVEGWLVAQVLGEGAYGEVRLLVHAHSGAAVALKAVAAAGAEAGAAREAALHRALRHAHVLRCLGERAHHGLHYLFLEYAQGGELFDRIEPDVGMAASVARRYWRQLLAGLQYLHARGVAHRDIKPENLLLDAHDNIKIADFGMATLFRHGARERLLSRVCGTVPYAAPEVLRAAHTPYRAPPADLWAAALVLLAMLAGELPWERAHESEPRYAAWLSGAESGVWRKLSGAARDLLRAALCACPARRATLRQLQQHAWTCATQPCHSGTERAWSSQPGGGGDDEGALSPADMDALLSASQPAAPHDLLLSTQPEPGTQGGAQDVWQRLARRMTRVCVRGDARRAMLELRAVLRTLHYAHSTLHARLLAVECAGDVRMRVSVLHEATAGTVLEFRRWRGCGLEFKRRFLLVRAALEPVSVPLPPLCAPLAAPAPMDTDGDAS